MGRTSNKTIYIGGDHAGFELKQKMSAYLKLQGYTIKDFGAHEYNPDDDYPDFVIPVAGAVAKKKGAFGIAVCGTGDGACIAANKVKGVRAAFVNSKAIAYSARHHNGANVLCLGGGATQDHTTRGLGLTFVKAKPIIDIFLSTPFSGAPRHVRRLKKIAKYEKLT